MKRKSVIMNLAMSIDGYIARTDGSVDWLPQLGNLKNSEFVDEFTNFLKSVDVIIMGRKAWEATATFGNIEQQFPGKKIYVMTSNKNLKNTENTFFTDESIEMLVEKTEGIIWMFGGGYLAKDFFEKDLIDQIYITIAPIILGDGIEMFQKTKVSSKWTLSKTISEKDMITLHYCKKHISL